MTPAFETPQLNSAELVTNALTELQERLEKLRPGADGYAPADIDALADLQERLDLELRSAHALCPRGAPEGTLEDKPFKVKKDERRKRGEAHGVIYATSCELIEGIDALIVALRSKSCAATEIEAMKTRIMDIAMRLYADEETGYLKLLMDEGIGRTDKELKVGKCLRGYLIEWSRPTMAATAPGHPS